MDNHSTSTTASGNPMELNLDLLKDAIDRIVELDKNDPIKKILRDNGFNPDNGDMLVLPEKYKKFDCYHPNLGFSIFIETPILIKRPFPIFRTVGTHVELEDKLFTGI